MLLAGCGSSGSSGGAASGGGGATGTGATSSTPAAGASSDGSTTASPGAGGTSVTSGTPSCPTRDLKAKIGPSQGAAGSVYLTLEFTNISNAPCTLYGYPGVSLAGGSPVTQIGPGADRSTVTQKKLVTLAAGATASAVLQIAEAGNYPPSTCDPKKTTDLQIYPPNQTTPIYLAYSTLVCAKPVHQLSVSVVQAGSGGV
jgi:hypothetical protein